MENKSSNFPESMPISNEHMYSLSNIEITDAIVNPEGWTEEELILAKEISEQRDLKLTNLSNHCKKTKSTSIKVIKLNKKVSYQAVLTVFCGLP